jgi:hypothetical protein
MFSVDVLIGKLFSTSRLLDFGKTVDLRYPDLWDKKKMNIKKLIENRTRAVSDESIYDMLSKESHWTEKKN